MSMLSGGSNQNDAGITERRDFVESVLEEAFGFVVT